jgi:hypothetical protein
MLSLPKPQKSPSNYIPVRASGKLEEGSDDEEFDPSNQVHMEVDGARREKEAGLLFDEAMYRGMANGDTNLLEKTKQNKRNFNEKGKLCNNLRDESDLSIYR